jgi:phenylalanyl-tRNA synthetase beta chain
LEKLCFDYGIEVEQETTPESANYIFEVAANRPDLLSLAGIVLSLGIYLGLKQLPVYKSLPVANRQQIFVKPNCKLIRPFVIGCVLRDVTLNENLVKRLMDT